MEDGVYVENVVVDKSVAIQSLNGYASTAVVSTTGGNVFYVSAPDVTIQGFDVYGALTFGRAGIYFAPGSDGAMVTDNSCTSNGSRGLRLNFADDNQLSGNSFNFNYRGVEFNSSSGNVFVGNETRSKLSGTKRCQLELRGSNGNVLYQNSIVSYTVDVCSNNGSSNVWQSSAPVDYLFGGNPYTSVLGNYYSFGNPVDSDGNGVGDAPYALPGAEPADTHPLTKPIEEYNLQ